MMQKSHDPKILQLNLKYALFKDVICTEKLKKKNKKRNKEITKSLSRQIFNEWLSIIQCKTTAAEIGNCINDLL